jgi:DoxX-like family
VNQLLWLLQGFLALSFMFLGGVKLTQTTAVLSGGTSLMTGGGDWSRGHVKAIGIAEILGALGLVEPWAWGPKIVTPIVAACLAAGMLVAVVLRTRERASVLLPLVLGALCALVAVGRFVGLAR